MAMILGKKILVLGCSGAGKSTLSKIIEKHTGIPVYHLDSFFWNPGWVETKSDVFDARVNSICKTEQWIIDGNYTRTLERRLPLADTLIFLDFPTYLCTFRVIKRWLRYHGKTRPDMGKNCPEKIDLEFLRYIRGYPKHTRPHIIEIIKTTKKKVFHLKSPKEVEKFLLHFNS